ncbi:gas vesicle accessory protein GvpU [Enterobacter bugandensis]|uniref:gas vesicle accessory protein GvpU n=1 Tax=Enterobacter bugandensis TaxID=881260 RepID=UPI0020069778|nr:gas vesicle accessory protein GvpU [Enterobacter bugandensis]MCK6961318.1 hypothetical protein [Enterobacter bugandensis]
MEQQISHEVISRSIYDQDLEYLVNVVERANIDIGITLLVKGLLVSGMLVSNKKYYTQVSDDLQLSGDIGASIAEYFKERAKNFDVEKTEYSEPSFMNLIKVSFLKGDGQMGSMKGACLRLKIEEVDGYFLGGSQFE